MTPPMEKDEVVNRLIAFSNELTNNARHHTGIYASKTHWLVSGNDDNITNIYSDSKKCKPVYLHEQVGCTQEDFVTAFGCKYRFWGNFEKSMQKNGVHIQRQKQNLCHFLCMLKVDKNDMPIKSIEMYGRKEMNTVLVKRNERGIPLCSSKLTKRINSLMMEEEPGNSNDEQDDLDPSHTSPTKTNESGNDDKNDLQGGGPADDNTTNPPSTPVTNYLESRNVLPEMYSPIFRKLLKTYTSEKAPAVTVCTSANNKPLQYIKIPQCGNEISAATSLRKIINQLVDTVNPEKDQAGMHLGASWLLKCFAAAFPEEYVSEGKKSLRTSMIGRMPPEKTAAMMTKACLKPSQLEAIGRCLKENYKEPIIATRASMKVFTEDKGPERRYGTYTFQSRKGKKESPEDTMNGSKQLTVPYWVTSMYEVAQKELCSRVCEAPTTCRGMKFPLCDTKCLAVVFLADHGNTAFRAGITLVADDKSGPGDFKKVAHLRAKESVLMLQNTFLNDLVVGIEQLQGSVAVIVEREDQATALFGPRDAFVGADAAPFQGVELLSEIRDRGNEFQKLFVDNDKYASTPKSARFLIEEEEDTVTGQPKTTIIAITWESPEGTVVREFEESIIFDNKTKFRVLPLVVLGSGDHEWQAIAVGKENYSSKWCTYCDRRCGHLGEGRGEPWTLQRLKDTHDKSVRENRTGVATVGVKGHPPFPIPVHLWVSPILHNELGLVKDWSVRLEEFAERKIEALGDVEIQCKRALEEKEWELSNLTDEKETYALNGDEIRDLREQRTEMWRNINTRAHRVYGPVEPTAEEEYHLNELDAYIGYHVTRTEELVREVKVKNEEIKQKKKELTVLRNERPETENSASGAIDSSFNSVGAPRQVYHSKSFVGNHIQNIFNNREELMAELKTKLREVRQRSVDNKQEGVASEKELDEELDFFGTTLHCLDTIFGTLRGEKEIISGEKKENLMRAIRKFKDAWPTKRWHEIKPQSTTHKGHNIIYEAPVQVDYLGVFHPLIEDPIEKAHSEDRRLDELFSNVKGYIPKEESKRNREVMKSNPIVRRTQEEVHNKTRRNFSKKSVANKKQKIEQKVIVKDERRRQCE